MFASSIFEWRGEPFHAAQIIEMRLPVDGQHGVGSVIPPNLDGLTTSASVMHHISITK